ncbi:MAG: DUF805 domain-containing protein [Pseudomonadota bacterium]
MRVLLFSFHGRISRKEFWIGVAAQICLVVIMGNTGYFVIGHPVSPLYHNTIAILIFLATLVVFCYWTHFAVPLKRLHDRGKSWGWLLLYHGIINAAGYAAYLFPVGSKASQTAHMIAVAASIVYLIDLGLVRGERGDNRFGPDPLA